MTELVKPVNGSGRARLVLAAAAISAGLATVGGCATQPSVTDTGMSSSLRNCAAEDVPAALERTIEGLYAALSFPVGTRPSIGELERYFVEKGVLADMNGAGEISAQDEFIERFLALHQNGAITSLHEREAHHVTCVYGRVAHRFSFYEARGEEGDATPFAVGVNSIQLVRFGDDWKVTSWAWHDDAEGRSYFNRLFDAVIP